METSKSEDAIKDVPPIPEWFLANCMKTSDELAKLEIRIVFRDGLLDGKATDITTTDKYEVLSCMYQDLKDLVSSSSDADPEEKDVPNSTSPPKQARFTNDGVVLRLPGDNGKAPGFMLAIIEHFAREVGANMVKLSLHDIEALGDYLSEHQQKNPKVVVIPNEPEDQKPAANGEPQDHSETKSTTAEQKDDDDSMEKREIEDESRHANPSRDEISGNTKELGQISPPDSSTTGDSDAGLPTPPTPKAETSSTDSESDESSKKNCKSRKKLRPRRKSKKDGSKTVVLKKSPKHKSKAKKDSSEDDETDDDETSTTSGSSSSSLSDDDIVVVDQPSIDFYRQIISHFDGKEIGEQNEACNPAQQKSTLVIAILEIFEVANRFPQTLRHIRSCIWSLHGQHNVLIIATDQGYGSICSGPPPPPPGPPPLSAFHMPPPPPPRPQPPTTPPPWRDTRTLRSFSHNPVTEALDIVPVWSPSQKDLFLKDKEADMVVQNIRAIQKEVKKTSNDKDSPVLQPYNGWKVHSGSDTENLLKRSLLSGRKLKSLAHRISKGYPTATFDDLVAKESEESEARSKVIDTWNENNDAGSSTKWSRLPPHAYKAVKKIQDDPQQYQKEIGLLYNVIDPDEIDDTWSDIALEPRIKTYITQMVSLIVSKGKSRGLLKTSHLGGAILYGPPGTGKTQLARVLAKESSAVMIQVSSAELEQKWVGETPKMIKALFNLGKLLSPCIIFIDEAEALFRARDAHDYSFERTKVSQLLSETDGLKKSGAAPFLLLATNHPEQLDHAFLRRLPGRIFVGLPSEEARLKMLHIFLRDEELDSSIDLEALAKKTENYTGSDIKVLCVQAAMILLSEEEEESLSDVDGDKVKRLKISHFDEAFKRTSPTVRESSMAAIRKFAKEFDPLVVKETYLKDNPAWRDAMLYDDEEWPRESASMYI
ncbi:hypothetical protein HYFRA_00000684 [Hymenoscyphus fraxineus]|uniref:AAA+ ATPase domain-containing protein n=1 Tax=Hymenoscyphus fraxineus TaxID=746836 RepID=A0A9N9PWZ5_9HELO|nr:hypothetical protein HYFRA_00000684 [Hymenoscyphus fraxineus]